MIKTDYSRTLQASQVILAIIQILLAFYELYRVFKQLQPSFHYGKKRMNIIGGFLTGLIRVLPRLAVAYISIKFYLVGTSSAPTISWYSVRWLRY